jgi:hypothetical protein
VKRKLLFEEVLNYNKWTSGIASRELATQRVTLKDLFDKSVDQDPNSAKADKPLPYPLPNVIEQLGDLYINACNARMLFKTSLNNPVVQENDAAKEQVMSVIEKLSNIIVELKKIFYATEKPVAKK